jgi:hypothetical protein
LATSPNLGARQGFQSRRSLGFLTNERTVLFEGHTVKKYASVAAAFLIASPLAMAQGLPPTNMGKWVHQPGDNQYNVQTQQERHGTSYADRTGPGGSVYYGKGGGGGGGGSQAIAPSGPKVVNPMILMGGNKPKVDISIEPISSDEPVPPPGFPPLPERLQLPVALGGPSGTGGNWRGGGGGGGGKGGGGGASAIQGVHQHYVHLKPGAFQDKGGGGGGGGDAGPPPDDSAVPGIQSSSIGGANPNQQIQNPGGGIGYYKARTAPPPIVNRGSGPSEISTGGSIGGDNFNSGGPGAPRYRGASSGDLKKLGRAPGLDPKQDAATAPEAPQAAVVTQSTTQDLSLPDDEFVSRYGLQDTAGKRFGKAMGRTAGQVGKRVINRATSIIPF